MSRSEAASSCASKRTSGCGDGLYTAGYNDGWKSDLGYLPSE